MTFSPLGPFVSISRRPDVLGRSLFWLSLALAMAFSSVFPNNPWVPRWPLLYAAVPILLCMISIRPTVAHWLWGLFLAIGAASLTWSIQALDTGGALLKFAILGGVFCLGGELKDPRGAYGGLVLGVAVSGLLAMVQWSGFHPVQAMDGSPSGLFLGKNSLAEICGPVLILAIGLRMWWAVPFLAFGTFVPETRSTLLGLGAGLVFLGVRGHGRKGLVVAIALALMGAALLYWDLTLSGRTISANTRLAILQVIVANLQPFGFGLGTFPAAMPMYEFAHSEPAQMVFELGLGIVPLVALMAYCLGGSLVVERIVLIVLVVESCFDFTFHEPVAAYLAALLAGRLCGYRDMRRWVEPDGRSSRESGVEFGWPRWAGSYGGEAAHGRAALSH